MAYCIHVDEWDYETWEFIGRDILQASCNHYDQDKDNTNTQYSGHCEKCGISEDDGQPMMLYAYPLDITPSDEEILEIHKETCCTVVQNKKTDEYFIALCGGGMDLSQHIALAYIIAQRWIPFDLAVNVSSQHNLNFGYKNFKRVSKGIRESLKKDAFHAKRKIKEMREALKQSREAHKASLARRAEEKKKAEAH